MATTKSQSTVVHYGRYKWYKYNTNPKSPWLRRRRILGCRTFWAHAVKVGSMTRISGLHNEAYKCFYGGSWAASTTTADSNYNLACAPFIRVMQKANWLLNCSVSYKFYCQSVLFRISATLAGVFQFAAWLISLRSPRMNWLHGRGDVMCGKWRSLICQIENRKMLPRRCWIDRSV